MHRYKSRFHWSNRNGLLVMNLRENYHDAADALYAELCRETWFVAVLRDTERRKLVVESMDVHAGREWVAKRGDWFGWSVEVQAGKAVVK